MSEGEDAFRVQVVLPVALGSSSLGEPEVDLIAAAATRMAKYPVEDPLAIQVLVESQLLQVVQGARGLGDGIAEGMLNIASQRIAFGSGSATQE